MLLLIGSTFLNELIVKNIIAQPRPEDSCSTTYGMPSGHSLFSGALFAYTWLLHHFCNGEFSGRSVFFYGVMAVLIPTSRVYLHYHTQAQVVAGSLVGVLCAVLFFRMKGKRQETHDEIMLYTQYRKRVPADYFV